MARISKLGLLLLAGCVGCTQSESAKKAIVGATLVDGSGGAAIPDSLVLIEGETITAAGPAAAAPKPEGYQVINAKGKFVVPGLVDVGVMAEESSLRPYLLAGITSIGIENGKTVAGGPRMFPASDQRAGVADQVIASGGRTPDATFAKIERMAKAEIAPLQIIQSATQNGAVWLKQNNLGTIKTGQQADLLILSADPLKDIHNLRKIERVMAGGHWVGRD